MRYTVIWTSLALNELAEVWTESTHRDAVTLASRVLDERLERDPLNEGESRNGPNRISFEHPLRVEFRVFPDRLLVEVLSLGDITCHA